jgi:hypothetical protein
MSLVTVVPLFYCPYTALCFNSICAYEKNAFVYLLVWSVLLSLLCLSFTGNLLLNDTYVIKYLWAVGGVASGLSIVFAVKKYSDLKTPKNMQHE